MALLTPVLDDRTWQQLRDELVRRIPHYTPEWTDHNPGDPGITLLELFAHLGEQLLFRFNQIPDTTRLAFLDLLQIPLRPAAVATGLVRFPTERADGVLVPIGTVVRAGAVEFSTTTEVVAQPVDALAAVRAPSAPPEDEEVRDFAERAVAARLTAGETPAYYTVATLGPGDPDPAAEPLRPGAAVDGALWVALLRPDPAPAGPDPDLAGRLVALGVSPAPDVVAMGDVDPCPGAGEQPPTPGVVWRATAAGTVAAGDPTPWLTVEVVSDTTAGLTREGVVTLRVPPGAGVPALADPALEGTGDLPPLLEDDELADRVRCWFQAGRREGAHRIADLAWIGTNAATVEQAVTARPELLGTGTAEAGQRLALSRPPVLAGTAGIEVEEPGGWVRWAETDALHAAAPDERVYVLDGASGEVRFGDGTRGRPPQIGERVRVASYRSGGGARGNVPGGAIDRADVAGVEVANPLPTRGGADPEALAAALERIPGELRRRDRAVTADDFRELAVQTPGGEVARAECLPRFHPRLPSVEAAGVVTVVVWPATDPATPNAPSPDRALLGEVCRWLDARRLVTTELYVVPPTYRPVAVAVGLRVRPGYGVEAVRRWVELALRQYLAPLPPYGPEGAGWPMGRRVHGPELEAAALAVEGVEYLEGLTVAERSPDGTWPPPADPPTVELSPWEVPELVEITVVEGPPLAPGAAVTPAAGDGLVPVPVPVPKVEC
jgi:hypothetical protein